MDKHINVILVPTDTLGSEMSIKCVSFKVIRVLILNQNASGMSWEISLFIWYPKRMSDPWGDVIGIKSDFGPCCSRDQCLQQTSVKCNQVLVFLLSEEEAESVDEFTSPQLISCLQVQPV